MNPKPTHRPDQKHVTKQPILRKATPAEKKAAEIHAKNYAVELKKKKDKYQEKVRKAFNVIESKGSIGEAEAQNLAAVQTQRIEQVAQNKLAEYNKLLWNQRQARRDILIGNAQKEFEQIYHPVELIIEHVRGVSYINDKELIHLKAFLEAESKMEVNPNSEKLFLRILSNKKINTTDFDYIFAHCQTLSSQDIEKQPQKVFESSQVGALIGAMSDAQKMAFSRYLIKSKYASKPNKTKGLIESFYIHDILSTAQIENLYSDMPVNLSTYFKAMISNPKFFKQKHEYEQFLERKNIVSQGRGAENPLNKLFGMPGLYLLATLWGSATALVNLGANFNYKDIPGSLEHFFSGWGGVGLLTALGGGLGVANILSPKNKIGSTLHRWLHPSSFDIAKGDERKEKLDQLKQSIYKQFGQNPELPHWLQKKTSRKKTIFETLLLSYNKQLKNDPKSERINLKPTVIKIKNSLSPELQTSTNKTLSYGNKQGSFFLILKGIFDKFRILKVGNDTAFETFYTEYKKSQGLT